MHYKCGKTFLGRPTVLRSTRGPCSIKFGNESPTFVRNSCRRTEQPTWRQYPLEAHNPPCSKTPTKFQLTAHTRKNDESTVSIASFYRLAILRMLPSGSLNQATFI